MNADGFALLARLEKAGPEERRRLIEQIDLVAYYARTKKHVVRIEYEKLLTGDKVFAEVVTTKLLARLLENLT